MSELSDYKILADSLLTGIGMTGYCECRLGIDICQFCMFLRGLEALERLLALDPLVVEEWTGKVVERRGAEVVG